MIPDQRRRADVIEAIEDSKRELIALRTEQILDFAGNAIELQGPTGRILVMSSRAQRSLDPQQIEVIERSCRIVPVDVPTIELAGGSVRCMLAGVHLTSRRSSR